MSLTKSSPNTPASSSNVPLRSLKTSGIRLSIAKTADSKTANQWCDSCKIGFTMGPYLLRHWQQMHFFQKECILCNAHLDDDETVYYHMRRIHKAKKFYSCTCCRWVFVTEEDLRKHEKSIAQYGHPGAVRPVMKLTVQGLRSPKKLKAVLQPSAVGSTKNLKAGPQTSAFGSPKNLKVILQQSVTVQGKEKTSETVAQNIEAPRKMHADPNMKHVMSAGSLYPALFVRIGTNPDIGTARVSEVLKPVAPKVPVKNIPSEAPKRGTVFHQVLANEIVSTEGFMGAKTAKLSSSINPAAETWTEAETDAYNTILATLMHGPKKTNPTSSKPTLKIGGCNVQQAKAFKVVDKASSGNSKINAFKLPKIQKAVGFSDNSIKKTEKK